MLTEPEQFVGFQAQRGTRRAIRGPPHDAPEANTAAEIDLDELRGMETGS